MTTTESRPLEEQVALVTGGARGIGKAICKRLAELGATVVVNYSRSAGEAEALVSEIQSSGGSAQTSCFDVSDEAAVDQGIKEISSSLGRIDILVNNAGIAIDSLIMRAKGDDWRRTIDVNLAGSFYCAKAVSKAMLKARRGRIINISSVVGESGNAGQAAYSASKAGMLGLTKSLALELGSRGVTVNAVTPGYIRTDMTSELTEEQTQKISEQIALGRLGEAEDVADLVGFLASSGAGYITGQVIGVNGGLYM